MSVCIMWFYSGVQVRTCFTGVLNDGFGFYWPALRLDTRWKVCVCASVFF